jgi:hypothetical protein
MGSDGDGRRARARALALGLIAACGLAALAPGTASAGPGGLMYVSNDATSAGGAQTYSSER